MYVLPLTCNDVPYNRISSARLSQQYLNLSLSLSQNYNYFIRDRIIEKKKMRATTEKHQLKYTHNMPYSKDMNKNIK